MHLYPLQGNVEITNSSLYLTWYNNEIVYVNNSVKSNYVILLNTWKSESPVFLQFHTGIWQDNTHVRPLKPPIISLLMYPNSFPLSNARPKTLSAHLRSPLYQESSQPEHQNRQRPVLSLSTLIHKGNYYSTISQPGSSSGSGIFPSFSPGFPWISWTNRDPVIEDSIAAIMESRTKAVVFYEEGIRSAGASSIYRHGLFFFTFTSSLGAEVTDRELVFCEYFTRRTIAIDCFYIWWIRCFPSCAE